MTQRHDLNYLLKYSKYVLLIKTYIDSRNEYRRMKGLHTSNCFTYEGLFNFMNKHRSLIDVKPTTVERMIRFMVNDGLLERIERGRLTMFCTTKKFSDLVEYIVSSITPENEVTE